MLSLERLREICPKLGELPEPAQRQLVDQLYLFARVTVKEFQRRQSRRSADIADSLTAGNSR